MPVVDRRIRGYGCILTSEIGATGQPTGYEEIGEAPAFTISLAAEYVEGRNSCKAGNPVAYRELRSITGTVSITLQNFTGKNLARMVYGAYATVAASTITDQVWLPPNGTAFEEDKEYRLPNSMVNVNITAVKDNAGTPVTITSSKYTVDPIFGTIIFNDLGGYTVSSVRLSGTINQADDDGNLVEKVGFATGSPTPIAVLLKGKFDLDGKVYNGAVEIDKLRLEPATDIPWKSADNFAEATMTGTLLNNDGATQDAVFGNLGRHLLIGYVA